MLMTRRRITSSDRGSEGRQRKAPHGFALSEKYVFNIRNISSCWGSGANKKNGERTPRTAGSSCTLGAGCGSSTARSFTSDARKMMYAYGSPTGAMNWFEGLSCSVSGAPRTQAAGRLPPRFGAHRVHCVGRWSAGGRRRAEATRRWTAGSSTPGRRCPPGCRGSAHPSAR